MNAVTTAGHTCGWSVGQGNAAVAMPTIRLRCGWWHHPAGTTRRPWRPLSVNQALPRTCQAPAHIARYCLSQTARCRPRMMPFLELATQAVHFTEWNGLCRQCSGGVLPQKMLFLEFMWPDNRKFTTSEPFFELQLRCVDRRLPKICLNYKYLLLSSPWHLESQIW